MKYKTVYKVCITCGEEKPTSEYYRNETSADKLHSKCRSCHIKQVEAARQKRKLSLNLSNKQQKKEPALDAELYETVMRLM